LIGDSKIVLLDEPTAGMDLTARRRVWDMLKNYKHGRIVILTTHYMDEADILGDRIAIISKGRLRCCGSSLFLKNRYGVGYSLTIVKDSSDPNIGKNVKNFIRGFIPECKLEDDDPGEVTYQLPIASSSKFRELFGALDKKKVELYIQSYGVSVTTLEEVFLRVARGEHEIKDRASLRLSFSGASK